MHRNNTDALWSEGLLAGPRNKSDATRDLEHIAIKLLQNHIYACYYNDLNELIIKFIPDESFNVTQILKHEPDFEQLQIDPDLIKNYEYMVAPNLTRFFDKKTLPSQKFYLDKDVNKQYQDLLYAEKLAITLYSTSYFKRINPFLRLAGEDMLNTIQDGVILQYFFKPNKIHFNKQDLIIESVKNVILTIVVVCQGLLKITPLKTPLTGGELYRREGEVKEINAERDKHIESRNEYLSYIRDHGALPDEKIHIEGSSPKDEESIRDNNAPILYPSRQMAFFSTTKKKKIALQDIFGDKNPIKTFVKIKEDSSLCYDITNLQEYDEEERLLLPGSQLVYIRKSKDEDFKDKDNEFKENVYEAVVCRALDSAITKNYNSRIERFRTELIDHGNEYDKETLIFWFNFINHDETLATLKNDSRLCNYLSKLIDLKIIEEKSKSLLEAASYANESHFKHPFQDKPLCKEDAELIRHNLIIHRPNHNINNAMRTALLILLVIPHYASYSSNPFFKKYCIELLNNLDEIMDIQRAVLFFTSGRESEINFTENDKKPKEYKKKAGVNFMKYVKSYPLNTKLVSPLKETIQAYKDEDVEYNDLFSMIGLIKEPDYSPSLSELIFYIMVEAHNYDLARCFKHKLFAQYVDDIYEDASEQSSEAEDSFKKNIKVAQEVIKATGDRLLTESTKQGKYATVFKDYDFNTFYLTSNDPLICFRFAMSTLYDYLSDDIKKLYVDKNSYLVKNLDGYDNEFIVNKIIMAIKNKKVSELNIIFNSLRQGSLSSRKIDFLDNDFVLSVIKMDNADVLSLLLSYQTSVKNTSQILTQWLPDIIKYSSAKVLCHFYPNDKRDIDQLICILKEIGNVTPSMPDAEFIAEIFLHFQEAIGACSKEKKQQLRSFFPLKPISRYLVKQYGVTKHTLSLIKKLGFPHDIPFLETIANIADDSLRTEALNVFTRKMVNQLYEELNNINVRIKFLSQNKILFTQLLDILLDNLAIQVPVDSFAILLRMITEFYMDSNLTYSIFNYPKTEPLISALPNLDFLISNLYYNEKHIHFLMKLLSSRDNKKEIVPLLELAIVKLDINMLLTILNMENMAPSDIQKIPNLENYTPTYLYNMFIYPKSLIQLMKRDTVIDIYRLPYKDQIELFKYIIINKEIEVFRKLMQIKDKDLIANLFINAIFDINDRNIKYDELISIAIENISYQFFYNLVHNYIPTTRLDLAISKINSFMGSKENIVNIMSEINKISNESERISKAFIFIFSAFYNHSIHHEILMENLINVVSKVNPNNDWYENFNFLDKFLIQMTNHFNNKTLQLFLDNLDRLSILSDLQQVKVRKNKLLLHLFCIADNADIFSMLALVDKYSILIRESDEIKTLLWEKAFSLAYSPELVEFLLKRKQIYTAEDINHFVKFLSFSGVAIDKVPLIITKLDILYSFIKDEASFNFIQDHFLIFLKYAVSYDDAKAWGTVHNVLAKTQSYNEFCNDKVEIKQFLKDNLPLIMAKSFVSSFEPYPLLANLLPKKKTNETDKTGFFNNNTDPKNLIDERLALLKSHSSLNSDSFKIILRSYDLKDEKILDAAWEGISSDLGELIMPEFMTYIDKNELKSFFTKPLSDNEKSIITEDLADKLVNILWSWAEIHVLPKPII